MISKQFFFYFYRNFNKDNSFKEDISESHRSSLIYNKENFDKIELFWEDLSIWKTEKVFKANNLILFRKKRSKFWII